MTRLIVKLKKNFLNNNTKVKIREVSLKGDERDLFPSSRKEEGKGRWIYQEILVKM